MQQELPDFIEQETWDAFEEMRRKIRAPLTDFSRKRIIHKLAQYHLQGYIAEEILGEAIERCWRGMRLTHDAPRRQLTQQESSNVTKITQMASGALKRG